MCPVHAGVVAVGNGIFVFIKETGWAVETCSGESGRHGGIMFEAPGPAPPADREEDPEQNGGRCKTDENEHAGNSPCIREEGVAGASA